MTEKNHDLLISVSQQLKFMQKGFDNHLKTHEKIDEKIDKVDGKIWKFMMIILTSLLGGFGTVIFIILKRL